MKGIKWLEIVSKIRLQGWTWRQALCSSVCGYFKVTAQSVQTLISLQRKQQQIYPKNANRVSSGWLSSELQGGGIEGFQCCFFSLHIRWPDCRLFVLLWKMYHPWFSFIRKKQRALHLIHEQRKKSCSEATDKQILIHRRNKSQE